MKYSDIARSVCAPRDRMAKAPARGRRTGSRSVARRREVLVRTVGRRNVEAGVVSVADRLAARGADFELERRYASPVGRKVAQAWRARTGSEPELAAVASAGHCGRSRIVPVFGYSPRDLSVIDDVIDGYETADPNSPVKGRRAPRVRLVDLAGIV